MASLLAVASLCSDLLVLGVVRACVKRDLIKCQKRSGWCAVYSG
jgi:hypothetical protein